MWLSSNTAQRSAGPSSGTTSRANSSTCWSRWNWTCLTRPPKHFPTLRESMSECGIWRQPQLCPTRVIFIQESGSGRKQIVTPGSRNACRKKGTRSATRRMIALSGRERRLKLQTNHSIAKQIVNAHPHTLIGLEELTGIRERTRRRKRRRKKNGKGTQPVSKRARRANRHASQWAFAELHGLIAYKAALSRASLAIKVDANFTSQTCPLCGYTSKQNRPNKG